MKRRSSFAGLLALVLRGAEPEKKKFYVTGLYHESKFNDCTLPPLVCYGKDRVDALAHSGLTVWTEEEWLDFRNRLGKQFDEGCKSSGKLDGGN